MVKGASAAVTRVSDLTDLARRIDDAASGAARFFLAVAGPPGSGKSTLAQALADRVKLPSCVVPMDGFHLDNATLSEKCLLPRKGAPETFDLTGFSRLIDDLRTGRTRTFPVFDRTQDSVVPDGGTVPEDATLYVFEGNYLLFDEPGWADLNDRWDASVWIDVPDAVLEDRLVRRWRDHGLTEAAARARAQGNDMANARRVKSRVIAPTWSLAQ